MFILNIAIALRVILVGFEMMHIMMNFDLYSVCFNL